MPPGIYSHGMQKQKAPLGRRPFHVKPGPANGFATGGFATGSGGAAHAQQVNAGGQGTGAAAPRQRPDAGLAVLDPAGGVEQLQERGAGVSALTWAGYRSVTIT